MGMRAFYVATVTDFLQESADSIVGKISQQHSQDIVQLQMGAWQREIELLKECLPPLLVDTSCLNYKSREWDVAQMLF